jgi:TRIAD3 protein (E3 ubiquitin-protein ligase RNF216)
MPPPEQKPVIATTTTSTPAKPSSPAKKRKPYRRYKKNVKIPPVETEEPPEDPAAILERVRLSTIECEICCSDDIAADKVTMCSSGHVFCKDCARRMAEAQIGLRRSELPCMAMEGCGSYLEEAEVREFLAPKTFRLWERLRAEEEIKAAGLHGIEHCPFCDFAAVIESKDEKLFRCYNSECTKVSCRACNREDHIPKSCLGEPEDMSFDQNLHHTHTVSVFRARACLAREKRS